MIRAYRTLDQNGKVSIEESTTGHKTRFSSDPAAIFDLLLESKAVGIWKAQHDKCNRICWNLDETVAPILKCLGEFKCRRLLETKRAHLPPFSVFHVPTRIFSVTHIPTGNRGTLFGIDQYYPEFEGRQFSLLEVQVFGEKLMEEWGKMHFGDNEEETLIPSSLTSPVGVFTSEVLSKVNIPEGLVGSSVRQKPLFEMEDALAKPRNLCNDYELNLREQAAKIKAFGYDLSKLGLPRLSSIPPEVAEFAENIGGAWTEAIKLGHFKNAVDIDLTSAYASLAAALPDFRYCRFVHSKEYLPESLYGFVEARITINDDVVLHPIHYRNDAHDGRLETRVGSWVRHCAKTELDFISKWKIGKWEILDGYWILHPPRLRGKLPTPLAEPVMKLLGYKEGGGFRGALAKRASMFWGKFLSRYADGEVSEYFNPIWSSDLETSVRLKVCDFLYQSGIGPTLNEGYRHLCHVSTDGFLLDTKLQDISGREPEGEWRQSYEGEALVVSSGLVWFSDKVPRGLTLEQVKGAFERNPKDSYFQWELERRVTLADALAEGQGRFADLGAVKAMRSDIDFHRLEWDREYKKKPASGGALLRRKFASLPQKVVE